MQRSKVVLVLTLLLVVALVVGCKKLELDKIAGGSWNPNFAVPVAFGEFDVYDILARVDSNEVVVIDPNEGNISLMYSGDLFELNAKDYFDIPNINEQFQFNTNDLNVSGTPTFSGSHSVNLQEEIAFPVDIDVEIEQISLLSGEIAIEIVTNFRHEVVAEITLPDFLLNGSPMTATVTLNGAGTTGNVSETEIIDLSDVVIDLNSSSNNSFELNTEITINGSGEPVQGTEFIEINFDLSDLEYLSAIGYFGQNAVAIQDSILLRVFESVNSGVFQFNDPKFRLDITNSFGIPAQIDINELKTIVVQTGDELLLSGYPNNIALNSPATQGDEVTTEIQFDNTNTSNIESIVSPTPRYLYYDGSIQINPMGPSAPLNFILNTSTLTAKGEVELPLDGFAYGFEVRDTVAFSTGTDFDETEAITFVMFRLIIENGFPVDVQSQIRFMDENYNTVFTVFDTPEDIIVSGVTNSDGRVIDFTEKTTDIILTEDQIALMPNVEHIELVAYGETKNGPNQERVVFFDDYELKMKLALQVEGNQNF